MLFDKIKSKGVKEITLDMVVSQKLDIDASDIDGEKVMMNLEKGEYFMFNPVASSIWDIVEKPTKVSAVIDALLDEYEVEATTCEKTVLSFLNDLNEKDLIVIS